jgi:hypothetical protein
MGVEATLEGGEERGCGSVDEDLFDGGKIVERTPVGERARRRRARSVDVYREGISKYPSAVASSWIRACRSNGKEKAGGSRTARRTRRLRGNSILGVG